MMGAKVIPLSMSLLDWALRYAKNGWRVFPILMMNDDGGCSCAEGVRCTRIGKHPAIKAWQKSATTDSDQIKEWWGKWPKSGIGIATGEKSGITVLDVDVGTGGDVTLEKMRGKRNAFETATVETGSGGRHFYFKYTEKIKTVASKIGTGLDTRNEGGYVVAPPSRHKSGSKYAWRGEWDAALAEFPAWLSGEEKKEGGEEGRGRPRKETFAASNPKAVARLKNALDFVDASNHDRWISVGLILGRAFEQNAEGEAIYMEWSARAGATYDAKRSRKVYTVDSKQPVDGKPLTTASIYQWAKENEAYRPIEVATVKSNVIVDNQIDVADAVDGLEVAASQLDNVYERNGEIVKIGLIEKKSGVVKRDKNALTVIPYTIRALREEIGKIVTYMVENQEGLTKTIQIPLTNVQTLMERKEWQKIKPLIGFVRHPIFDAQNEIVSTPGFHAGTGLVLVGTTEVKKSKIGARELVKKLMDPMQDFEWSSPLDRSVFLAAFFTAGLRYRFPTAPMFGFSSASQGSGKGLLTDVIALTWQGGVAAKVAWSDTPDEMGKRLGSMLMAGDPIVCIDNVNRGVAMYDQALCSILTSEWWTSRILGRSESVSLDTRITLFATGNSLTTRDDMTRRTLICRIDPVAETPSARTKFKYPHLAKWITENRALMMDHAMNILKQYIDAGPSKSKWTMGSFEEWASFMDGLMIYLGETPLSEYGKRTDMPDESAEASRSFLEVMSRLLFDSNDVSYTTVELANKIAGNSELTSEFKNAYSMIVAGQKVVIEVNVSTVAALMKMLIQWRRIDPNQPTLARIEATMNPKTKQRRWTLVMKEIRDE